MYSVDVGKELDAMIKRIDDTRRLFKSRYGSGYESTFLYRCKLGEIKQDFLNKVGFVLTEKL